MFSNFRICVEIFAQIAGMEGLPVWDQPMGSGNLQARALKEEGEEGEEPEEKFKTLNIWTFLEETTAVQKMDNRNIKWGSL